MARPSTLELLERLMAGELLSVGELDAILVAKTPEDLHLEYKNGASLAKSKEAARMVREYVSAFANSAGGVLVIGVEDHTLAITGCAAPGTGTLEEWTARCLTNIGEQIAPPPRFSVVKHPKGDVLVIATARSPSLVALAEDGGPAYYFRIGEQTLRADPYLMADLLLGRRQHPTLSIPTVWSHQQGTIEAADRLCGRTYLRLAIRNDGVAWVDGLAVGGIFLAQAHEDGALNPGLLQFADVERTGPPNTSPRLVHLQPLVPPGWDGFRIEPFGTINVELRTELPLPPHTPYHVCGALYLVPRGAPVQWFQFEALASGPMAALTGSIARRCHGRPVVAWRLGA